MKFVVFFLTFFSFLSVTFWYVGWRSIQISGLDTYWKRAAWLGLLVCLVLVVLSFFVTAWVPDSPWRRAILWATFFVFGFLSIVFAFILVRDIFFTGFTGVVRLAAFLKGTGSAPDYGRRALLMKMTTAGIWGASGLISLWGAYRASCTAEVVKTSILLPHLPPGLEGTRIVQITDLHAGPTITGSFVSMVAEKISALNPDMIIFTGDMVDGPADRALDHLLPLKALSAPMGKFFVTGNHEYYSGIQGCLDAARMLGFEILINENRIVLKGEDRLAVAGVTDIRGGSFLSSHRSDPQKAMQGISDGDVSILLAHQPVSVYEGSKCGADVQISGHTHGGQYFPWTQIIRFFQPFVAGWYRVGKTQLYVSRGTGYWGPPMRTGAPEITEFTLTRGSSGPSA